VEEIARARQVVDKFSGKSFIDKRYLALSPIDSSEMKSPLPLDPEFEQEFSEIRQLNRKKGSLDKYLELVIKNSQTVEEFLYLQNYNKAEDPYDLEVVSYAKIQQEIIEKSVQEYFTVSRSGLCLYVRSWPVQHTPLLLWLKERQNYDKIKALSFFSKFRSWKTLKM